MANEIFYVKLESPKAVRFFAFSRSETGILDYQGAAEPESAALSQMQCVDGSAYFTPSWYSFLPTGLQASINVYLPGDVKNMDAGQYSFLLHVGALLLAVEERDGLLVAELLRRRSMVFAHFIPLVLHIVKPIAAEALFVNLFGGFRGEGDFKHKYKAGISVSTGEEDVSAILYAAAFNDLKPQPEKETVEEMFIRYFANRGKFDFTIGIVGATNHPWLDGFTKLEKVYNDAVAYGFAQNPAQAGEKCQEVLTSLACKVQVEPYNPHDPNAISVSLENPDLIFRGIRAKSKAGYLRATAAAILRRAMPNRFSYDSCLWRLGARADYFENAIVLRLKA
jgi:hypothetical protein